LHEILPSGPLWPLRVPHGRKGPSIRKVEVFAQACRLYEETVAAVTHTRQQLFDLPMLVTFLAHAPPEESMIALRRLEQYCRGLHGIEEALDAAATHVVQTWYETRTNGQGEETTRGC
jgi:hypothetical protein